ncbi:hypothetical protein [Frondihabitans peucedani]|uniref:Membrane protein n=1 Tax=Frondihabitans peucedani TaxID=598626 RepID=A0ABP8DX91_9MICO
MTSASPRTLAAALAAVLAASGTLHLVRPQTFDPIVPRALPGERRTWTLVSGYAELATAAALAAKPSRRIGGSLAALLFVAVFPANIVMARQYLRSSKTTRTAKAIVLARLPLQVPLVLFALRARG